MKTSWPWALAGVALVAGFASLLHGDVQAARDLSAHVFPETFFLITRWSAGQLPLWLPNARMGQPFAALLYTQAFYAPRIVSGLLFGHVLGPNVMHLFHAGWAFAGLYFAGRRFGLQRAFAFIGAAPFALSPFFIEFAQNLSFASTASWAGWTLWAAEGVRRGPSLGRAAWLAACLGLAFHAGAPEMWLWQAMLAAFVLVRTPRALGWGAVAVAWAGLLSAVVALPALELTRAWTQPGEVASGALEWSVSAAQVLSIFIPDADLPRDGPYWGGADQRFLFTLFTGSVAMLLALVGVRVKRARPVLALTVLALVLSLGRHLVISEWLLAVPPFRLFRYPAKYVVGALFGASLLAGFGARRLVALSRKGRLEAPLGLLGFALGLVLASRWSWAREGFRHGAPWLLLASTGVLLLRRRPVLLAVWVALELIFVRVEKWDRVSAKELTRASRVAPLLRGEGRLSLRVDLDDFDHEACGPWDREDDRDPLLDGRDRLAALRFVEEDLRAVGGYGFREPWRLKAAFSHGVGAFAVAGVSSFLRETWAVAPPGVSSVALTPIEDLWIWRSTAALPRGFFVSQVRVAASDEAAFAALDAPVEELARSVTVDRGDAIDGVGCEAQVTTTELSPVSIEQRLTACAAGAVVLADAWYPGWIVEVDGARADVLRAWGFVRAVRVTPGAHIISWRYEPRSFRIGAAATGLGLLGFLGVLFQSRRRRS